MSLHMTRVLLFALLIQIGCAWANSEPNSSGLLVEKIDSTTFRFGEITFESKNREIRIPTWLNMEAGLLEFLLVHEQGKIHESLLFTKVRASELLTVFHLLKYQPLLDGRSSKTPLDVRLRKLKKSQLKVEVEWKSGCELRRLPIENWVENIKNHRSMTANQWILSGSIVSEGKLAADRTGDLLAILVTEKALLNYRGNGNNNDDVWQVFSNRVPRLGTPVTLIFSPLNSSLTE